MQFRVLRPRLQVVGDDGTLVPIPQALPRGAISTLLVFEGQPLTRLELMELIWAQPVAGGRLRTCLYEVRRAIGKNRLVWNGGAYRLLLEETDWCDLTEFHATTKNADQALQRQDLPAAAQLLDRALRLWHDKPLQDLPDTPAAIEAATAITEEMRQARDTLVTLKIELEQFRDLVGPLTAVTEAEPLNEEAWAHLMTALYQCGRQAEALHAYHRAHKALQEANVEPGEHLRQLRRQIQARDPALDRPSRTARTRETNRRT